ncbi:hypothetical protein BU16DRAFT_532551 [Lophium mytilinum]|uniref:F-box domain-containing protein n=1 Tax=Lophium mytilinum TaxID=390894 RepID=A0A6A6RCI4_9PEZI|nr:hypothetical protein BU16DRAFT_532551 [Lophium mytilinum]
MSSSGSNEMALNAGHKKAGSIPEQPGRSLHPPSVNPILSIPAELIDMIDQHLPRNSFLALRQTCKDLMQETDYHLTERVLKEKRIIFAKSSRAGLHSLANFCNHPPYANRAEKVVIALEASFLALATDSLEDERNRHPESSKLLDRQRIADLGLIMASLSALPALDTVEVVDAHASTSNTFGSPSKRLFSASEQATYTNMLHKGLVALAIGQTHLQELARLFNVPLPTLVALVQDWDNYGNARPWDPRGYSSLKSLRTLKIHADPYMLYHDYNYDFNLPELLMASAPALERLDVNGGCLVYEHETAIVPFWTVAKMMDLGPQCMRSVTLRNVRISNLCPPFGTWLGGTMRQLTLEGVAIERGARIALEMLATYPSLTSISVRAIFDVDQRSGTWPWVFGTIDEEMLLRDFFFLGARTMEEGREMWRKREIKVDDVPGSEYNRDLVGWKFEGEGVAAGVKFLAENGRRLQR